MRENRKYLNDRIRQFRERFVRSGIYGVRSGATTAPVSSIPACAEEKEKNVMNLDG